MRSIISQETAIATPVQQIWRDECWVNSVNGCIISAMSDDWIYTVIMPLFWLLREETVINLEASIWEIYLIHGLVEQFAMTGL
jgi:hypothetical protein